MAFINSVNIDRIRWCISDRGISIDELADETGIEKQTLHQILNGEILITLSQLKSLAKFFNRGILFFVAGGIVNENKLRTSGFRTLTNEHPNLDPDIKSLIERVERQRQIYLNLREELGEGDLPKFNPPDVPKDKPEFAATIARRWLSTNGDRTFNGYRRLVESKGVLVFRSNGYSGPWQVPKESEVAGFSIYHRNCPIIFVRKHAVQQRQLFTLAHELGHLILHGAGSIDNDDSLFAYRGKERDVNEFAGSFLVPNEALRDLSLEDKPASADKFEEWLRPTAQTWGVSVEVILLRLLGDNRVTRKDYEAYKVWKHSQKPIEGGRGNRQYRYREPVHVFGKSYVGTVLEALGSQQITATKASRFLDNIKINDVHRLQREFNAL